MKAVCITAVAPPGELADTFEIRDVLDPMPGPDQFRVRVPYTAVNIDPRTAEGRFVVPGKSIRPSGAKPHAPGHDFAWASTRTASRSPSAVCRVIAPPAKSSSRSPQSKGVSNESMV